MVYSSLKDLIDISFWQETRNSNINKQNKPVDVAKEVVPAVVLLLHGAELHE